MTAHDRLRRDDGEFLVCLGASPVAQFARWAEAYRFANALANSRSPGVTIIAVSNSRTLLAL